VPVLPEQTVLSVESQPGVVLPVTRTVVGSNGAGETLAVTLNGVVVEESWTEIVTVVAAATLLAASTKVLPDTLVVTGSAVASLENAWYGGTPPVMVKVAG